jgi:hypothetical protein
LAKLKGQLHSCLAVGELVWVEIIILEYPQKGSSPMKTD